MSAGTIDPSTRRVPPLGGLNGTVMRIELMRMLRNRRTIFLRPGVPGGPFPVDRVRGRVGRLQGRPRQRRGVPHGLHGAVRRRADAAAGGATVATERAMGWSRPAAHPAEPHGLHRHEGVQRPRPRGGRHHGGQRRRPRPGRATMPTDGWVECAVLTLACTTVFAALGLFVGYLVPGENACSPRPRPGPARLPGQRLHPDHRGQHAGNVAACTPMFGVAEIGRGRLPASCRGTPWSTRWSGWACSSPARPGG